MSYVRVNFVNNLSDSRKNKNINYTISNETEKAICLHEIETSKRFSTGKERTYERDIWLPRSQVFGFSKNLIIIATWLAGKNNLDCAERITVEGGFDTPQKLDEARIAEMKKILE